MIKKILTYVIMFFMLQMVITSVVVVGGIAINGGEQKEMTGTQMVVVQCIFGFACLLWFLWRKWTPISPHFLKTKPYTLLAWCVIAALETLVPSMWLQECIDFLPDISSSSLLKMMDSHLGYFTIAVLTPVAEEIVFRGAILRVLLDEQERRNGSLTTKGMWLAIAISALIFGVVHLNPAQIPHAFLIGLLLGWVYARTRSIIPGTVIHIVNNTATYLLAVAYINTPDITLSQILGGSQKYVWMSLLFSLCLLLPALFQLNLRMRKQ